MLCDTPWADSSTTLAQQVWPSSILSCWSNDQISRVTLQSPWQPSHDISSQTINMSLAPVDDFCYLGSMMSSPLEDLKHRRGMAWGTLWKLETLIVSCYHIYGAESWPIDAQMTRLISSFGTSAYHIMTGVKRLDKVCNTTVLVTVSRNELIHTAYDHQLRFLGHMQKPMRYTSQLTAVQDTVVLEQSTLITSRN